MQRMPLAAIAFPALRRHPRPWLNEFVQLIESDPSLTARILGLCRRADRPVLDRITTVRRAVVMVGVFAL